MSCFTSWTFCTPGNQRSCHLHQGTPFWCTFRRKGGAKADLFASHFQHRASIMSIQMEACRFVHPILGGWNFFLFITIHNVVTLKQHFFANLVPHTLPWVCCLTQEAVHALQQVNDLPNKCICFVVQSAEGRRHWWHGLEKQITVHVFKFVSLLLSFLWVLFVITLLFPSTCSWHFL